MKSNLTKNQDRPAINELADLLFVPSSLSRLAHTKSKEGYFQPKEKEQISKFAQIYSKVYPYLSASFLESFRLYGYYKLGETIIEKLL